MPEFLGAVGCALSDDLDVDAFQAFEHAVHAVIESGHARHAFEDAERVAVLQHRLEIASGDLAGFELFVVASAVCPSSWESCCP